jgi:hypothetical protein
VRRTSINTRIAANERQVVSAFRTARAVSIRAARSLADLGLNNTQVFQSMVGAAIVRRAGPERFFLDEDVWARRRAMSGRNVWRLLLAATFAVAAAAYYFLG